MEPSENATSIARLEPADLMWSGDGFDHVQRVAKLFAASELIPPHLRGKVPDVSIALMMARRLDEDPLVIMQSIYVVQGRAGWSAQYVIGRANRSGVFQGRINWRETGIPGANDYAVTAFATLADGSGEVSFTASMAMAQAEGWTKNPKYRSMPSLMLRYRSATLLVRLYAPEVMLGIPTSDELEDVTAARAVVYPAAPDREKIASPPPATSYSEQEPAPAPRANGGTLADRLAARATDTDPPTVTANPVQPGQAPASSAPSGGGGPSAERPRKDVAATCRELERQCAARPDWYRGRGAELRVANKLPPAECDGKWAYLDLIRYESILRGIIKAPLAGASSGAPASPSATGAVAASGAADSGALSDSQLIEEICRREEALGMSDHGIVEARGDHGLPMADLTLRAAKIAEGGGR